uniref:Secreted protein n=1 Tax=Octopus bimaculoides TaxID=37653 RepID=A0A0L8GG62_OCTBM
MCAKICQCSWVVLCLLLLVSRTHRTQFLKHCAYLESLFHSFISYQSLLRWGFTLSANYSSVYQPLL